MEIPVAPPEVLLNRFLYMSETESAYIPGDLFVHQYKSPEVISDLIRQLENSNKHEVIETMFKKYMLSGKAPNNSNAVFVLAVCCGRGTDQMKAIGYKLMPEICKSPEDLMLFVKFISESFTDNRKKGFGKGMRRAVSRWYLSFEALELAKVVGLCRSKHGRSHKDILSMAHTKASDNNVNAILAYAVHGYKEAKQKISAADGVLETPAFTFLTDLHNFKSCDDPERAARLIEVHHFPVNLTPAHMLKNRLIWEAAVNNFSLMDTLFYLHRLHNMGFLTPSNINSKKILPKVLSYLRDKNLLQKAKLHPLQVYIILKNYENGGKLDKYPKSEHKKKLKERADYRPADTPCSAIVTALKNMVDASMTTHNATGARFMITLDMHDYMFEGAKCCQCENVSPGMAGVILALALLKREREVTVCVFSDRGVQPVGISRDSTLEQALDKLKSAKVGHVRLGKPIDWCTLKKKRVDVFINVTDSPHRIYAVPKELRDKICILKNLVNYRTDMNLPNCRLATMFLTMPRASVGRNYLGCIDFGGLDENVPKILEHFAKNNFK